MEATRLMEATYLQLCINTSLTNNIILPQVFVDSVCIEDIPLRSPRPVRFTTNQDPSQSLNSTDQKEYKVEILVENMGRTNFDWNSKRMRKGNMKVNNCRKQPQP